jgi:murein DD-endopeptidase MepM/ murein hydrolase activator NlpD
MLRTLRLRAVSAGVVRKTGYAPGYDGYGKIVLLDVAGPYTVLYAHLSSVRVKPGQRVGKGQRLGRAGCTGSCSGTHLHFEVLNSGVPVNPLRFLG